MYANHDVLLTSILLGLALVIWLVSAQRAHVRRKQDRRR